MPELGVTASRHLADPRGEESRHVPASVKRAVWVRDLGRCAFVGSDGHRCGERSFVEFHHVRPYAIGGEPTVGNIELRCQRHNDYEARVFFARGPVAEVGEVVPERMARGGTAVPARSRGDRTRVGVVAV